MKRELWYVPDGFGDLASPSLKTDEHTIKGAMPFTLLLRNAVVSEDLDGWFRGDNDIMIHTSASLGSRPAVRRVHYYEEEVPKGTNIDAI